MKRNSGVDSSLNMPCLYLRYFMSEMHRSVNDNTYNVKNLFNRFGDLYCFKDEYHRSEIFASHDDQFWPLTLVVYAAREEPRD